MKVSLCFVLVTIALFASTARAQADLRPAPTTVYVINHATRISDQGVLDVLPAFQAAVSNELQRYWHVNTALVFTTTTPPAGASYITLQDSTNLFNALGYHDLDTNNVPFAVVGVEDGFGAGYNWEVTFTHELFEMLVDPYVDKWWSFRTKSFFIEIGDPVEADQFAYLRRSATGLPVMISDFVTPAWYNRHKAGPYDFHRRVKRPRQVLPGGYVTSYVNSF